MTKSVALSVLDLAKVAEGTTGADAVNRSVALAQRAEDFGYTRCWTAEHDSMPMVAPSAPDLIALRIADTTTRFRVGAGGVTLPNHSPLQVAERYLTHEAFHPGRIDLGVGRAPGTNPAASAALRRSDARSYPEQLAELDAYLDGAAVDTRSRVRAFGRCFAVPLARRCSFWDRAIADSILAGHVVGGQDHVRTGLLELATQTGADELMIATTVHGFDHHVRSLQLISEALDVCPTVAASHASVG